MPKVFLIIPHRNIDACLLNNSDDRPLFAEVISVAGKKSEQTFRARRLSPLSEPRGVDGRGVALLLDMQGFCAQSQLSVAVRTTCCSVR